MQCPLSLQSHRMKTPKTQPGCGGASLWRRLKSLRPILQKRRRKAARRKLPLKRLKSLIRRRCSGIIRMGRMWRIRTTRQSQSCCPLSDFPSTDAVARGTQCEVRMCTRASTSFVLAVHPSRDAERVGKIFVNCVLQLMAPQNQNPSFVAGVQRVARNGSQSGSTLR